MVTRDSISELRNFIILQAHAHSAAAVGPWQRRPLDGPRTQPGRRTSIP